MIKTRIEADIPDERIEEFLTLIRTFDRANPGCHFKVICENGNHTVEEMEAMVARLDFPIILTRRRQ